MEENNISGYKKKAGIFITAIILTDYLVRICANMLLSYFSVSLYETGDYVNNYKIINQIVNICLSVFSIFLILFASYIFTKDKRKTVILAGSIYFGKCAAGLVSSLISTVADCLTYTAVLYERHRSFILSAGHIITIPLIIAVAYFVFTAFEGINPKLETNLGSSEMLLPRAKKRYVVTYIIVAIITSVLTSVSTIIIPYFSSYDNSAVIPVLTKVSSWLSGIISFTIIYYAGYNPYRNHIDGMSFVCVSEITGAISGLLINIAMLPFNFFLTSLQSSGNYTVALIFSGIAGASALITLAIDIILIIYMLRFFFEKSKISLFAEDTAVKSFEETDGYIEN